MTKTDPTQENPPRVPTIAEFNELMATHRKDIIASTAREVTESIDDKMADRLGKVLLEVRRVFDEAASEYEAAFAERLKARVVAELVEGARAAGAPEWEAHAAVAEVAELRARFRELLLQVREWAARSGEPHIGAGLVP